MLTSKCRYELQTQKDKNVNFIRDNFLMKELEEQYSANQVCQLKDTEIGLLKKRFENEKSELRRIIDIKNHEIEDYRIQLEGILREFDYQRKMTQRNLETNQMTAREDQP